MNKSIKNFKIGEFIPVINGKKIGYGGYQKRLMDLGVSKFYADRSCVVTAFTNVYLYLYRWGEVFTKEEFNKYQKKFFDIIKPKVNGVPTTNVLKWKVDDLREEGIFLKANILNDFIFNRKSKDEIIEFIEKAIEKDLPVILLNWQSKDIPMLKHHAVTITAIEKRIGKYKLIASSRSKKYTIDFDTFYDQFSLYKGFIYFEREDIVKFIKVETFIPKENVDDLIESLNKEDILKYGNYDSCYSLTEVLGHFRPLENSNPYIGEENVISEVNEMKVEFRIKREDKNKTDRIIRKAHPYEEPVINYLELL
ncbi:MAG: hypothetical protein Q4B36_07735 [Tissierellia bacterium]|nr:hypothetical protein [Tissierellia bacterium]